jgi:hypothetical protein
VSGPWYSSGVHVNTPPGEVSYRVELAIANESTENVDEIYADL